MAVFPNFVKFSRPYVHHGEPIPDGFVTTRGLKDLIYSTCQSFDCDGSVPLEHRLRFYARDPKTGVRVVWQGRNTQNFRLDKNHFRDGFYFDWNVSAQKGNLFRKTVLEKRPVLFLLSDEFAKGTHPVGLQSVLDYAQEHKGQFLPYPLLQPSRYAIR